MVGARIRAARRMRGWTQLALAQDAGVSRKFLVDLEAGHAGASLGLTLAVLNSLGMDLFATFPRQVGRDFGQDFESVLSCGDYDFALRLLGEYAHEAASQGLPVMMTRAPRIKDQEYRTTLAAITRWAAAKSGAKAPRWARESGPSPQPVFPAEKLHPVGAAMKNLIRRETPAELANMNVWIRERDLSVA
ncbi:helix-turn-helix domain-containing protein [Arthrobacter sp. JSM 101049]|uniref:helix-turn-helix domain-containing protein n=1 Tax=Arthrobacter sp. JSM 101049 TaxID=929097 RepID=UPI0035688ADD